MKKIWKGILAMSMGISLMGCANVAQPETTEFTIVDQAGREVSFSEPAQRVASGYYIATTTLIGLGAKDQLVAVEMKADTREIYHQAAPEILDLPALGNKKMFNVEACAQTNPDVVFLPIALQSYVEQLEALDLKVILLNPETKASFEEAVQLIAKICGKEERAQAYAAFTKRIEDTYIKTGNEEKTVYMAGVELLKTAGNTMFQVELLHAAQAKNAFQESEQSSWTPINIETLLSLNPDVIFLEYGGVSVKEVMMNPTLSELDAIKNQEVYVFPSSLETWDTPNLSYCLGVLWAYHVLYPQSVSKEDVAKEAKAFYQEFYGIDVDVETLGI